jgi:hypothetical protein
MCLLTLLLATFSVCTSGFTLVAVDALESHRTAGALSPDLLRELPRFPIGFPQAGDTTPSAAFLSSAGDIVPEPPDAEGERAGPGKHRLASYLALSGVLGAGAAIYYSTPSLQDFDQSFGEAWRQRFTRIDRHRFDDNGFRMNHVNHAVAGRGYYGIARAGNLSAREAVLFTALGSSIWEYLIEVREVVSLNDQVVTIGAGSVLGEALYQHQNFLLDRPDLGSRNAAAAWILGFPFALPGLLARPEGRSATPARVDGRSMTRELTVSHSSQYTGPRDGAGGLQIRIASSVRKVPPVAPSGWSTSTITGIPVSRLSLQVSPGESRTDIFSAVSPLLWSLTDMHEGDDGSLRGFRLLLGPSWSFRMSTRTDAIEDRAAVTTLLGMAKELEVRNGLLVAAWASHASFDFTAIQAHALPAYMEDRSLDGAKAVLKHGYYYGYGGSLESRAELGTSRFGIEAEGFALGAHSIQGLDRWQKDVVDDFSLSDARMSWKVGGVLKIRPQIDLTLARRGRSYAGRAKEIEVRSRESDTEASLRIRF